MVASVVASASSFGDRIGQLLSKVEYRLAGSPDDREAIFRLRYEAYLREGAIGPNASRRFTDEVDNQANTWSFGVHVDGVLAGSMRISVTISGLASLPALAVFPDVVAPAIAAGRTIIDPTRFVIDRASSRRHPELPYVMARLAWIAMPYFQADLMLIAVRAEHQAFYKRLLGSQVVCPPRPYPELDKPISLMTCEYDAVRDEVHRRHPYFRSDPLERERLFGRERCLADDQLRAVKVA
jgi:hypothetical protein